MNENPLTRVRPTLDGLITTARNVQSTAAQIPPATPEWLLDIIDVIADKFATSKDARGELSEEDENEYLKQFAGVGEAQARQALSLLRSRYHWRPSVAQVRAAVEDVKGEAARVAALPAAERQLLRSAADLRAEAEREAWGNRITDPKRLLPGTGESRARQAAREMLRSKGGWKQEH